MLCFDIEPRSPGPDLIPELSFEDFPQYGRVPGEVVNTSGLWAAPRTHESTQARMLLLRTASFPAVYHQLPGLSRLTQLE